MSEIIYEFGLRLPLRKLLDPARELEESINANLAKLGVEEKLCLGFLQVGTVKVERELTADEISKMKKLIRDCAAEEYGTAAVEYFRRQSGNVQQSVIQ
jgi:hypothetical protein